MRFDRQKTPRYGVTDLFCNFLKKVAKKVLTTQYFFGKIVFADAVRNRVEKAKNLDN